MTLTDRLGGRKFVLSLIVLSIGTLVQIYSPHGVNESFVALLIGALGVFNAANAVVTSKSISAQAAEASETLPPEPAVDLAPLTGRVDAIASEAGARIEALEAQVAQSQEALVTMGKAIENTNKRIAAALTR